MKGWRPSACPLARRRIGLGEAGEFLPDVGSIGLSFSARSPGLMTRAPWTPSLFALIGSAATDRTNDAQASAIMKKRQPFTCLNRPEEPKAKTEGTDDEPGANTPILPRHLGCRSRGQISGRYPFVMAGLVPAIHAVMPQQSLATC